MYTIAMLADLTKLKFVHFLCAGVVDSMSDSPLISACHSLGMRLYLFHHGCDTEDDQKTLLSEACRLGRLDVVKSLLEDSQYDPAGECEISFDQKELHVTDTAKSEFLLSIYL